MLRVVLKLLGGIVRVFFAWWVPTLLLFGVLILAVLFWLLGTGSGTRALLGAALPQFGGTVESVSGSVLGGVRVGKLAVSLPDLDVDAEGAVLDVEWLALLQRRLHVREVSVQDLRITLKRAREQPAEDSASGGAFAPPLDIAVDRLAVGRFTLVRAEAPDVPLAALSDVDARVQGGASGAHLDLASLNATQSGILAGVQGSVDLRGWGDPWPMAFNLQLSAQGQQANSPLCLEQMLGSAPAGTTTACRVTAHLVGSGDLHALDASVDASAAGAQLTMRSTLTPLGAFPLRQADLQLTLPDGAHAAASLQWTDDTTPARGGRLSGALELAKVDPNRYLHAGIPPAMLNAIAHFDMGLNAAWVMRDGALDLKIAEGSRWNRQELGGTVTTRIRTGAQADPGAGWEQALSGLMIDRLDADLRAGRDRLRAQGSLGKDDAAAIDLEVNAPELAALWPGLPGAAEGKLHVAGTAARHRAELKASYTPANTRQGVLGKAKAQADLAVTGSWGLPPGMAGAAAPAQPRSSDAQRPGTDTAGPPRPDAQRQATDARSAQDALTGWRGTVTRLDAEHAGFSTRIDRPVAVSFLPDAAAPQWQWQVGAAAVAIGLPGGERITLDHQGSRGRPGAWETAGRVDNLAISRRLVSELQTATGGAAPKSPPAAPAVTTTAKPASAKRSSANTATPTAPARGLGDSRIALDAVWNLKFAGALSGTARVTRRDGDLRIPGSPPLQLGLRTLVLNLNATPVSATTSRLDAAVDIVTAKMGSAHATASAMLAAGRDGALGLAPRQPVRGTLHADMSDIGWVDIFTGDATEVGGSIKADVTFEGTPDVPNSPWRTNGTISGTGLRFIRIDDGVRLVDGTLAARLQDDSLILQSLRFPTAQRVTPGDSRIRDYLKTADAQGGYLSASGNWSLSKSTGTISIDVHRYPAVQRSDRYIMLSGKIDLNAALPRLSISGNLTADCGWVSLEVLSQVPTLDDDVKIIRVGTRPGDGGGDSSADDSGSSGPLAINMDLKVDLGSRFYITGMGLDAGLAGALDIRDADGRLTGVGAVRTRSGRIDAYGQRLQITQGVITFQGALDNPLLDIEALRVNQQVQAGVKVTGTARRPRIDLVSIPDVSEVEKLSWLILGRAPNQGGNDAALLISAGTSLLGGGEPFYKRFGLDDVSMRSGTIGSSGSLLPDQTVASQVTQSSTDSTLATQFLVASKNFSNGVTLSVEQAMAGSQTVGRLSYRLARHWSVDLKGGGVTGLALVYRTFFED